MSKIKLLDLFEEREVLPVIEKVMFKDSPIFALRVDFEDWRVNDLIYVSDKLNEIKSHFQYQSLKGIKYFSAKKYLLREVEIIKCENSVFYKLNSKDTLMANDYFKSFKKSVLPIPERHNFIGKTLKEISVHGIIFLRKGILL